MIVAIVVPEYIQNSKFKALCCYYFWGVTLSSVPVFIKYIVHVDNWTLSCVWSAINSCKNVHRIHIMLIPGLPILIPCWTHMARRVKMMESHPVLSTKTHAIHPHHHVWDVTLPHVPSSLLKPIIRNIYQYAVKWKHNLIWKVIYVYLYLRYDCI